MERVGRAFNYGVKVVNPSARPELQFCGVPVGSPVFEFIHHHWSTGYGLDLGARTIWHETLLAPKSVVDSATELIDDVFDKFEEREAAKMKRELEAIILGYGVPISHDPSTNPRLIRVLAECCLEEYYWKTAEGPVWYMVELKKTIDALDQLYDFRLKRIEVDCEYDAVKKEINYRVIGHFSSITEFNRLRNVKSNEELNLRIADDMKRNMINPVQVRDDGLGEHKKKTVPELKLIQ